MAVITNINDGGLAISPYNKKGIQYNAPCLITRFTGLDGTSAGDTVLYTISSSAGQLRITEVIINMVNSNNITVTGVAEINNFTFSTTICASTALTGLNATNLWFPLYPVSSVQSQLASTNQVSINMTTPFTAVTATMNIDIIGYFF